MYQTILTPFKAFQIYNAVFLHYNTEYDYHKNQGETKYTQEMFDKRRDVESFKRIADDMNVGEIDVFFYEYYVSWLFFNHDKWITPKRIIEDQARFMLEWINFSRKRLYNFKIDMLKLHHHSEPSFIFNKLELGDIHYASLLILNRFTNIISLMDRELDNPFWIAKSKRMLKFEPFYFDHEPMIDTVFLTSIPESLCRVVS